MEITFTLPCRNFLIFLLSLEGILQIHKVHIETEAVSIERVVVDSAKKTELFDFFHVMPEGNVEVMAEWDLLLTMDQYQTLHGSKKRTKRKALSNVAKRWTKCVVHYEITESLQTSRDEKVIKEAIAEWEKYTCLSFVESSSKQQRIQFKDGQGCYSKLGMQDSPQPIALASGCRNKGTIVHEIGHAVGWIHEHMRPDRDEYVYLNFDAIDKVHHDNYRKYEPNAINTYGIPYDYTSLMHYGNKVFEDSIWTLDKKYQDLIGQRTGFSFKDIKLANVMYNCSMFCNDKLDCKDGFQLIRDHKGKGKCKCWCDSGDLNDPLILCSDRATAPPPPEPSGMPTVLPKKKCEDVRKDCKRRKQLGHCMTKMDLMAKWCPKTCGFCDKEVCMDYDKGCAIMAAAGSCDKPGMDLKMLDLCKASCGGCPKPPNPCDVQKEMMGDDLHDTPGSGSIINCCGVFSIMLPSLVIFLPIFAPIL